MMMTEMTIISSSSVKPGDGERRTADGEDRRTGPRPLTPDPSLVLPVTVLLPVQGRALGLGVHVEDVDAVPARRVGLVVAGARAPLGLAGGLVLVRHRVVGDAPQINFLAERELRAGRGG